VCMHFQNTTMNTVRGFCDLNIPLKCYPTTTLKEVVLRAVQLGYSAIAINTVIQEDFLITAKKKGKKKDALEEVKEIPPPPTIPFTEQELSAMRVHGNSVKILQRLTVTLSDPSNTQKLIRSVNAKQYDLLAVLPTTSAAFQHAATNMDIDIITYDPDAVTELRFNRKQYRQATDRGIFFEIPYSAMLRDSSLRKKIIHMSHLFHSIGKSKNIIISSGGSTPLELRGPYDVANLGLLLGLTEGEARSALSLSGRSVALHGVARKTGKCVSYVSETKKLSQDEQWKVQEIDSALKELAEEEPAPKKRKIESNGTE